MAIMLFVTKILRLILGGDIVLFHGHPYPPKDLNSKEWSVQRAAFNGPFMVHQLPVEARKLAYDYEQGKKHEQTEEKNADVLPT